MFRGRIRCGQEKIIYVQTKYVQGTRYSEKPRYVQGKNKICLNCI